jgi:hypothetical protein
LSSEKFEKFEMVDGLHLGKEKGNGGVLFRTVNMDQHAEVLNC